MKAPLRFLVLDDDQDSVFLHRHALEKAFPSCTVTEANTCEAALAAIRAQPFDALLADHHLCGESGGECIARIRRQGLQFPILMVTASEDPKIHAEARACGATEVFSPERSDFVGYLKTVLFPFNSSGLDKGAPG